jgi:cell division protein FtsI (penicillin-binding protein 3)
VIIVVRLVVLQVVHYGVWLQRAQRQQQRTEAISPQRGVIYDRNGQELAMTVQVDSVFAVPSEIPDQKTTATLLATLIGEDPDSVLTRMQAQRNFAWVARKVDGEIAARIRSLNLRGIYFQKELKRFYPKRAAWKIRGLRASSIFTRTS